MAAQVSGLGVGIATAGGFLLYVGIKDVPIREGLRDIIGGKLPESPGGGGLLKIDPFGALARARQRLDEGMGAGGLARSGGGQDELAEAALAYLGVPYRWGGETRSGMDCSGLVQRAFADIGIKAPRTTYTQEVWSKLKTISRKDAASGDLVFWPGHVAVYLGGGQVVHAPRPGTVVRKADVDRAWSGPHKPHFMRYTGGGGKAAGGSSRADDGTVAA